MRNLITDVPGLLVGNAQDAAAATGVTAVLFDKPPVASVAVLGGAPGTRETDLLAPQNMVPGPDAIVLSGGSAFGLDAASGVQAWLRENGRGFAVRGIRVPIVCQAVCFDLLNGGDKKWGRYPPYRELGYEAAAVAAAQFALGTAGGGYGATTFGLKGGLGSASAVSSSGFVVGALAIVNAIASAMIGDGPHFFAAPFEHNGEFGALGLPPGTGHLVRPGWKGAPERGTTIAVVATDARLDKAAAQRLALCANGGLHKALRFANAATDGDAIFAAATGASPIAVDVQRQVEIGALAADCLARAIARGVYEATALPFPGALPSWRERFGALADRS